MKDFRRGAREGFKGNRGGGRFGGGRRDFGSNDRSRGDKQMFSAVCGDCGQRCEVPFRPTGERPVYCSNCFGGSKPHDSSRNFDRRDSQPQKSFSKPAAEDKRIDEIKAQLQAIAEKVDRIVAALASSALTHQTPEAVVVPEKKAKKTAKKK